MPSVVSNLGSNAAVRPVDLSGTGPHGDPTGAPADGVEDPLPARLRALTWPAHKDLDRHPVLAPLVRRELAEQDYGRALAALHGPQQALETLLRGYVPEALLPARLGDLERDLAVLGLSPIPLGFRWPDMPDDEARLGALYVIEGSNMGGTFIARTLAQSGAAHCPRSFFANAGGPGRWQRFWSFAGPRLTPESLPRVAAAAVEVFRHYARHLDACAPPG